MSRQPVPPWPLALLRIVTGYALIRGAAVLIARHLLGLRGEASLAWNGRQITVDARTFFLGREVRRRQETIVANDLVTIGVEESYPLLPLTLGALGLFVGAMLGLGFVFDGIEAQYVPLGLVGLGILAAGALLDVALISVADHVGQRASVLVEVRAPRWWLLGRRVRLCGVDPQRAVAFTRHVLG